MGTLTTAATKLETHYGMISVDLKRSGSKIQLTLTVPEGTVAQVPVSKGKVKEFAAGKHVITIKK